VVRHRACGHIVTKEKGHGYWCSACKRISPASSGYPHELVIKGSFNYALATFREDDDEDVVEIITENPENKPCLDSIGRRTMMHKLAYLYLLKAVRNSLQCNSALEMKLNILSRVESRCYVDYYPEPVAAVSAEVTKVKRRGVKGGWRKRSKRDGYCYSKLFMVKDRKEVMAALGAKPQINDVYACSYDYVFRKKDYRLEFVKEGSHVVYDKGWPTFLQWDILVEKDLGRRVGSTLWNDIHIPCASVDEPDFVMQDVAWDQDLEIVAAEYYAVHGLPTGPVTELPPPLDAEDEFIPEELFERKPRKVGGSGDCWMKLPIFQMSDEDTMSILETNEMHAEKLARLLGDQVESMKTTREEIENKPKPVVVDLTMASRFVGGLEAIGNTHKSGGISLDFAFNKPAPKKKEPQVWAKVLWEYQDDGDFHIVNVVSGNVEVTARGVAVLTCMKCDDLGDACDKHCVKEGQTYTAPPDFVELLRSESHKLVGKPSVSPLDNAAASFATPEVRATIEKTSSNETIAGFNEVRRLCPYSIPAEVQHIADELRIPWSKTMVTPHDHPLHAAIRRWELLVELPKWIKCDTTFFGMKEAHFKMVKDSVDNLYGSDKYKLTLVNPVIDFKDIGRYAGTNTVPSNVWAVPKIETPAIYCHESGHYMSPAWLLKLRTENPGIRAIGMSTIFPLLSLEMSTGPDPDFADWRIEVRDGKKILIYIPERHLAGKYEQPYDPSILLAKRIEDKQGELVMNGGIVASKGNTHIQWFYAYHVKTPDFVNASCYNMMKLPRLFRGQPDTQLIRVDHYVKMYSYAMVITSQKEKNLWGKLRQFQDDSKIYFPVADRHWLVKVVAKAAEIGVTTDLQSKEYNSLGAEIYYKTLGHCIRMHHNMFRGRYARRNASLVNNPDPVYSFEAIVLRCDIDERANSYAVQWVLEGKERPSMLRRISQWLNIHFPSPVTTKNREEEVKFAEDGAIVWPMLDNTWMKQQLYGKAMIQESQRRDFLRVYEKKQVQVIKKL
jgi:hypothetical protein